MTMSQNTSIRRPANSLQEFYAVFKRDACQELSEIFIDQPRLLEVRLLIPAELDDELFHYDFEVYKTPEIKNKLLNRIRAFIKLLNTEQQKKIQEIGETSEILRISKPYVDAINFLRDSYENFLPFIKVLKSKMSIERQWMKWKINSPSTPATESPSIDFPFSYEIWQLKNLCSKLVSPYYKLNAEIQDFRDEVNTTLKETKSEQERLKLEVLLVPPFYKLLEPLKEYSTALQIFVSNMPLKWTFVRHLHCCDHLGNTDYDRWIDLLKQSLRSICGKIYQNFEIKCLKDITRQHKNWLRQAENFDDIYQIIRSIIHSMQTEKGKLIENCLIVSSQNELTLYQSKTYDLELCFLIPFLLEQSKYRVGVTLLTEDQLVDFMQSRDKTKLPTCHLSLKLLTLVYVSAQNKEGSYKVRVRIDHIPEDMDPFILQKMVILFYGVLIRDPEHSHNSTDRKSFEAPYLFAPALPVVVVPSRSFKKIRTEALYLWDAPFTKHAGIFLTSKEYVTVDELMEMVKCYFKKHVGYDLTDPEIENLKEKFKEIGFSDGNIWVDDFVLHPIAGAPCTLNEWLLGVISLIKADPQVAELVKMKIIGILSLKDLENRFNSSTITVEKRQDVFSFRFSYTELSKITISCLETDSRPKQINFKDFGSYDTHQLQNKSLSAILKDEDRFRSLFDGISLRTKENICESLQFTKSTFSDNAPGQVLLPETDYNETFDFLSQGSKADSGISSMGS